MGQFINLQFYYSLEKNTNFCKYDVLLRKKNFLGTYFLTNFVCCFQIVKKNYYIIILRCQSYHINIILIPNAVLLFILLKSEIH